MAGPVKAFGHQRKAGPGHSLRGHYRRRFSLATRRRDKLRGRRRCGELGGSPATDAGAVPRGRHVGHRPASVRRHRFVGVGSTRRSMGLHKSSSAALVSGGTGRMRSVQRGVTVASNELLSTAEAARILGITRRQVLELAASIVDLPQAEPAAAGGRRWPRAAIEAWRAAPPDRGPVHQGPELPPVGPHKSPRSSTWPQPMHERCTLTGSAPAICCPR
jgi:predicted DNA-binding transcriptional regulator AlpA